MAEIQLPVKPTAPTPAQLASKVPTSSMSDSELIDWINDNQGKFLYDNQGQLVQIPSMIANDNNIKSAREIFTGKNSTYNGASLSPLGAAGAAATPAAAAAPAAATSPSYLTGSGSMTWNDIGNQGYSAKDIAAFQAQGWSADQVMQSIQSGAASAPTPQQDAYGITRTQTPGNNYTTLTLANGQTVNQDSAGNYFTTDANGNNTPVTDQQAQKMGFQSANPETQAQNILKDIDPTSEAIRGNVGQSYLDTLNQTQNPQAKDYTSYLDLFKQVDPEEYSQRQGMATSMDAYLKQAQAENALGSQLDAGTVREVEQGTRAAQAARGNVYGTSQLVQEAMQRGSAGEARAQQRYANLGSALGQQQGYLGAGLGLGDTALQLYQTGLANKSAAAGNALSYLSSGQTPYQAGAAYEDRASGNAANSAQGGPVYNPASLGSSYAGSQFPQYGLDVGAQSQSYYNSLNAQGGTTPTKNKTVGAVSGALSGAASGAMAGSAAGPGYGTLIGAGVGAVAGGAMGYYS